ncbi:MAG: recombination protein RecR [Bacteroidales bacterium]|nr:recombination protein RecR [Bacteroidales bacterium]
MEALPSKLLEKVVDEFSKLPGVGKQTALRFALHLLKQNKNDAAMLPAAIDQMLEGIKFCKHCHSISDSDVCEICSNPKRQKDVVCVVENIQGVMAIEHTAQYTGVYHVLGGVISPIDGIGINDLTIGRLLERVENDGIKEVILALPTTMEGDTTNFYINKQLQRFPVNVSTLARGVAIGDNLEYADEITLGRSIINRVPFDSIYHK